MATSMASRTASASGVAQRAAAPVRARSVRVCSQKQGIAELQKVQTAAAAFAAAALLQASPAFAGVVLEQPQLKKVFQSDAPAVVAKPAKAAAGAPAAPKAAPPPKAAAVESSGGGGISAQAVALPASLAVIAGGAFALTKLDDEFTEFMRTAAVKDSAADGAGYEIAIKEGGAKPAASKPATKAGTKKVKATAAPASKSVLGSIFGSLDN